MRYLRTRRDGSTPLTLLPMANAGRSRGSKLIEVRASSIHGRGVFALADIAKGTRISEYRGERITRDEADRRYDDDAMEHAHTFHFTLDDNTLVDGSRKGNDVRFVNHSCAPNCISVIEDERIFIDAITNIPTGGELTYDYRLIRPGRYNKAWDALYACLCGASTCRGTMLLRRRRKRAAKPTKPVVPVG